MKKEHNLRFTPWVLAQWSYEEAVIPTLSPQKTGILDCNKARNRLVEMKNKDRKKEKKANLEPTLL